MSSDDARILVTTQLDAASLHLLRAALRVDYRPGLPPAEVEARIGGYQALIVDSASRVSGRTIEYGYRLAALAVLGPSLANVSVSAARAQGIAVLNVPAALTLARRADDGGEVGQRLNDHVAVRVHTELLERISDHLVGRGTR